MMPLEIGAAAPRLTLPSHDLKPVSLDALYAQGTTVLLFFPLAFTGTCTEELCAVRDGLAGYADAGAQVVALSVDSPFALARYRAELGAPFPFLSDFNREAAEAFGVLREGPVGPGLMGASDRAAFVVDREGIVRYVWHSTDTSVLPPLEEVRAAAEELAAAA